MTIQDYLIDHTDFDWPHLLADWADLLPPKFTAWLVNRFGDLFFMPEDGTVHMLDISGDEVTKVAESHDDFCNKIDEGDNANIWLMIPLIDTLVAAGIRLRPGQFYSFRKPIVLGGDYTVENTGIVPIVERYSFCGSIHRQLRNLPDGTQVVIEVIR